MAVRKEKDKDTWLVQTSYVNYEGRRIRTTKRGFKRKKDALEWEEDLKKRGDKALDMTLRIFMEMYKEDNATLIRKGTWETKEAIIEHKILPYLGERKMNEITAPDIRRWQNDMKNLRKKNGEHYAETYLRSINSQLSTIFNHAVKFYGLKQNPVLIAGTMGKKDNANGMKFWTQEEYGRFIVEIADNPEAFYAFELLYWCGIRLGELLALTPADFNFETNELTINKSCSVVKGEQIIGPPKTEKSYRTIIMQQSVAAEIKMFIESHYKIEEDERLFKRSKSFLHHHMDKGAKKSGVQRIRVHDLRHSHVSLLIHMGFNALAIGERVGHEAEEITYKYAHLFPSVQTEMVNALETERRIFDD